MNTKNVSLEGKGDRGSLRSIARSESSDNRSSSRRSSKKDNEKYNLRDDVSSRSKVDAASLMRDARYEDHKDADKDKATDRAEKTSQKLQKGGSKKTKKKKKKRPTEVITVQQKMKPAKSRAKKRTFLEKLARSLGFHFGAVVLKDPRSLEAAQALNLQQWHLRRLKAKFDKIDVDSSGNIDYEEFFEAMGESRSPFTDKLFALIGTIYHSAWH
jgi:hypothetical protein